MLSGIEIFNFFVSDHLNVNLWSIKKVFFSLGYQVLPQQRVCQGVLEIFLSYCSICFLITKFQVFKSNI